MSLYWWLSGRALSTWAATRMSVLPERIGRGWTAKSSCKLRIKVVVAAIRQYSSYVAGSFQGSILMLSYIASKTKHLPQSF